MKFTRRSFLAAAASCSAVPSLAVAVPRDESKSSIAKDRFDPWLEVIADNLRHNLDQISRLTAGRPILAVVKNNAYGLGLDPTAALLEADDRVSGFAVVKVAAAHQLRDLGIRKPIVLMGLCSEREATELVARKVQLSLCTEDAVTRIVPVARTASAPLPVHLYLDTGLGRMGVPYHRALPWIEKIAARSDLKVRSSFMCFTEEPEFDREQLARFQKLAADARAQGCGLGALHAASSNGVYHLPQAHLDQVRPGIALYGAYPSRFDEEREKAELQPAFRLKVRVTRVQLLRAGDSVSYGRKYIAKTPTYTATLPIGHADGWPRKAVDGAVVSIRGKSFPIIGAVSASHSIAELGPEPAAAVGDEVTLLGPEEAMQPNRLSTSTGVSVYDVLMHLNPNLPKIVV